MEKIKVKSEIKSSIDQVWRYFTQPEHIVKWNFAVDEWHCPKAENDLKPGGKFNFRMEAKDESMGFDFKGTYDEILPLKKIIYHLDDGRRVEIRFEEPDGAIIITEVFDAEESTPVDMQRQGWQSILDNFRKYLENN